MRELVIDVEQSVVEVVRARRPVQAARRSRHNWFAFALWALGLGAAIVALLGPLGFDVIRYHASVGAINQIMGGDVAGLVLVAPVSVLAGILIWRGHRAGPVLALGPAAYALYMYSQLALGGDIIRYPGNSERFFLLFLGLFVLAGAILIRSWRLTDSTELPVTTRRIERAVAIFFLVVAAFLTLGLHLPGLIDAWSANPSGTEYLADPVVFWLVKFMDLGLVVPALVVVGIGLLLEAPWARKVRYPLVGWAALLGASVAGMAVVMQATGDPAASVANTVAFGLFAAVGIVIAWLDYRPLFGSRGLGHRTME